MHTCPCYVVDAPPRFPAHEHVNDAPKAKIPTVIYYDRAGKVCAAGAEATKEGIFETAEEKDWTKAEWYVLCNLPLATEIADNVRKVHIAPQKQVRRSKWQYPPSATQ